MIKSYKYHNLIYFLILSMLISCSSIRNNGYEKFVLPENFKGSVIVFYDEMDLNSDENKEGEFTIYDVPESGIYFTKMKIATGVINHKYYRKIGGYNEEIRRITFPLLDNEKVDEDSIYVMNLRPGEFTKRPIGSEGDSSNFGKVKFISFIVGEIGDREKLINDEIKKRDSLIVAYLQSL